MKLSLIAIIAAVAAVLGFSAPSAVAMPRADTAPLSKQFKGEASQPVHYRRYRHYHRRYRPRRRYYRRYYRPRYRSVRRYHCHRRYCHTHRYRGGHRHRRYY